MDFLGYCAVAFCIAMFIMIFIYSVYETITGGKNKMSKKSYAVYHIEVGCVRNKMQFPDREELLDIAKCALYLNAREAYRAGFKKSLISVNDNYFECRGIARRKGEDTELFITYGIQCGYRLIGDMYAVCEIVYSNDPDSLDCLSFKINKIKDVSYTKGEGIDDLYRGISYRNRTN